MTLQIPDCQCYRNIETSAELQRIWVKFHAFSHNAYSSLGVQAVNDAKKRYAAELWELALKQRNPGPHIHFIQDYPSHFGWDDVRGHAIAGHSPDFLDNDHSKAREMTLATIEALKKFMSTVLNRKPKQPNMTRIWEVLEELYQANPAPLPGASLMVVPKDAPALEVVNNAIDRDFVYKSLPIFTCLPQKWYQFDFDNNGSTSDPVILVEEPKISFQKEEVTYTRLDKDRYKVVIKLPYRVSGLKNLNVRQHNCILSDLAVFESYELSGTGIPLTKNTEERRNGTYVISEEYILTKNQIEQSLPEWTCTIEAYGADPEMKKIPISLKDKIEELVSDCEQLIREANSLMSSDPVRAR